MGRKNFYAVKRGNGGPAIYTTWPECEARVKGFQGAVFKGFVTRAEAQAFLDGSAGPAAAAAPAAKKAKGSGSGVAPSRPCCGTRSGWTRRRSSSGCLPWSYSTAVYCLLFHHTTFHTIIRQGKIMTKETPLPTLRG